MITTLKTLAWTPAALIGAIILIIIGEWALAALLGATVLAYAGLFIINFIAPDESGYISAERLALVTRMRKILKAVAWTFSTLMGALVLVFIGLAVIGFQGPSIGPTSPGFSQYVNYGPQWTPDGSHIVFQGKGSQGESGIFVVDSDGTTMWEVSPPAIPAERGDYDISPSVSLDGSRIAFVTKRYVAWIVPLPDWVGLGQHNFEIVTTALDGSDMRRLTENWHFDFAPVWSPDGTRIAFVSDRHREDYREIYTMAADGSDVRRIAPSVEAYSYPVWSPDGRRIAFVSQDYDRNNAFFLYVVGADGSSLMEISETAAGQPVWSPDGRRIAFAKEIVESKHYIHTADPDGSNIQRMSDDVVSHVMSWSPDGGEILYGRIDESRTNNVAADRNYWLSALNVNTGETRPVADLPIIDFASWSPDGFRIAGLSKPETIISNPGAVETVVTVASDGSDARVLVYYIKKYTGLRGSLQQAYGEPLSTLPPTTLPAATSIATPAPVQSNSPSPPVTPPCDGEGSSESACGAREVGDFTLFSANHSGAAHGSEETSSIEDILKQGLQLAGASPVHLAFRGSGRQDSARCEWRGVARTVQQREEAIRFWLSLGENDPLPSTTDIERQFMGHVNQMDVRLRDTMRANFTELARGGLSTEIVFLSCYADYGVHQYLLGSGPSAVTVAYDRLGEARSYELYRRSHDSGRFGEQPL